MFITSLVDGSAINLFYVRRIPIIPFQDEKGKKTEEVYVEYYTGNRVIIGRFDDNAQARKYVHEIVHLMNFGPTQVVVKTDWIKKDELEHQESS